VVQQLKQLLSEVKPAPKAVKPVGNLLPEGSFDQIKGAKAKLYMISPWELVESQNVTINSEWKTYTMEVIPTKLGAGRNLLVRMDHQGAGTLLIDDVKLASSVE